MKLSSGKYCNFIPLEFITEVRRPYQNLARDDHHAVVILGSVTRQFADTVSGRHGGLPCIRQSP